MRIEQRVRRGQEFSTSRFFSIRIPKSKIQNSTILPVGASTLNDRPLPKSAAGGCFAPQVLRIANVIAPTWPMEQMQPSREGRITAPATIADHRSTMYETSETTSAKAAITVPSETATKVAVLLVGGYGMVRQGVSGLLEAQHMSVAGSFATDEELTAALVEADVAADVVVQLICNGEPFAALHRVENALAECDTPLPLVILADQSTRGYVYGALRAGAKAYVHLDDDPSELIKAITLAAKGQVYLAGDAAELLVSDVSGTPENSRSSRLPQSVLSKREIEIVRLMCEGLSSKEIGRTLHISPKTVENHRYNIYRKCGIESLASLVRYAIQHGLATI